MDNLGQRRLVAAIGLIAAFVALTALIWGVFTNQTFIGGLISAISIIIAYGCTRVINQLKKKGSKLK